MHKLTNAGCQVRARSNDTTALGRNPKHCTYFQHRANASRRVVWPVTPSHDTQQPAFSAFERVRSARAAEVMLWTTVSVNLNSALEPASVCATVVASKVVSVPPNASCCFLARYRHSCARSITLSDATRRNYILKVLRGGSRGVAGARRTRWS